MPDVQGNLSGIRKSTREILESLYKVEIPAGEAITADLAALMARLTAQLGRELAVYLNRRGQVVSVAVGDTRTVSLPETAGRRAAHRLSGIRCIHTHPTGDSELSALDLTSLKEMRFDLMAALGVDERASVGQVSFAYISGWEGEGEAAIDTVGPLSLDDFVAMDLAYLTGQIDRRLEERGKSISLAEKEQAILVGVESQSGWDVADSLEELAQLAETAGATVVGKMWQKRDRPDAALFVGRGKVLEIAAARQEKGANLVIFDDELSPAQQRNLEQSLGTKVLDRTALILDIFAQRARTHEGKLQVELAQLKYNLPRLGGQGLVLSRLGGGIGTRGPGETKLEVDRRRIRERIADIEREIRLIRRHRELHRQRRQDARIPGVALVGYTNAGKSTLLNALTAADVLAEDKLFATLDPTTRKITLPGGQEALLTDTVGFIQKLPHQLVAAFRATLEEVVQAELLLHVIDASHPLHQEQSDAVFRVLGELGAADKPVIPVFNKVDRLDNPHLKERLLRTPDSVAVSALGGEGIAALLDRIRAFLRRRSVDAVLLIPYSDSGVLARLYDLGAVNAAEYTDGGIRVSIALPPEEAAVFQQYLVTDEVPTDE
ncbi:GTPase HflX [Anaeroselena agilis]|uniref:GTPase HflX n=1 Tax=Anaeroselena agilis TaxID=3063788 RepID=A0ABU3NX68_9FIRM|nr:GTPase HflX [Selenomonadales bacterium 4137-cl]